MPVPKAPVHEDNQVVPRKSNVWASRKVAAMKPETIAEAMKRSTYGQLRRGVAPANARHHRAALRVYSDRFAHWKPLGGNLARHFLRRVS